MVDPRPDAAPADPLRVGQVDGWPPAHTASPAGRAPGQRTARLRHAEPPTAATADIRAAERPAAHPVEPTWRSERSAPGRFHGRLGDRWSHARAAGANRPGHPGLTMAGAVLFGAGLVMLAQQWAPHSWVGPAMLLAAGLALLLPGLRGGATSQAANSPVPSFSHAAPTLAGVQPAAGDDPLWALPLLALAHGPALLLSQRSADGGAPAGWHIVALQRAADGAVHPPRPQACPPSDLPAWLAAWHAAHPAAGPAPSTAELLPWLNLAHDRTAAAGTPPPAPLAGWQVLGPPAPAQAAAALLLWRVPPPAPASPPPAVTEGVVDGAAESGPADNDRESIAYSVSHDLRAPIRIIEGFTRIVREDYDAVLDRVGRDHLDRVLGAAARMNHMIDALMALARLSTQPLARESVPLSDLALQILEDLCHQNPGRVVQVSVEPGLYAQGDPTLLHSVLENLLGNAWKYSARRPVATVSFGTVGSGAVGGPLNRPAGQVVYAVRDNGAGFDMRFAHRLFSAFQRLHSASEFAGTGVGLASVRRIVRRHGGEVWAESTLDQGTTFYFTLG